MGVITTAFASRAGRKEIESAQPPVLYGQYREITSSIQRSTVGTPLSIKSNDKPRAKMAARRQYEAENKKERKNKPVGQ